MQIGLRLRTVVFFWKEVFVLKPLHNIGETKKLKCSQIYT